MPLPNSKRDRAKPTTAPHKQPTAETGNTTNRDVAARGSLAAAILTGCRAESVARDSLAAAIQAGPQTGPVAPTAEQLETRNAAVNNTLAARYDLLNKALAEAETHLKSLRPVRDVRVPYNHTPEGPDGRFSSWELLVFGKWQGNWRLLHAYDADYSDDGPDGEQPLVECPIEVRVKAVKEIRRLHAEILADKQKFIPEVEEAISEVLKYCAGK
jgi:hypothetical protein